MQVVLDEVGGPVSPSSWRRDAVDAGFGSPPYPYDRLARSRPSSPRRTPGGMVDCSVGTPCDPPPPGVIEALASSGTERGYPASAGSPALRGAAAAWLARRFGVGEVPAGDSVAACVGTKELVASVPHLLRLRQPERDTVLYPAVSYPTYAMGAGWPAAGRSRSRLGPDGRAASTSAPSPRPTPTAPWCCGRTRRPTRPGAWATSTRGRLGAGTGVPVFSDECYAEFTWAGPPRRSSSTGPTGWWRSTRSPSARTWPGCGSGSSPAIPSWSGTCAACAATPGSWCPARSRPPGRSPWPTTSTWRPNGSATASGWPSWPTCSAARLPGGLPEGGFYLWVPVPADRWRDAWAMAEALAAEGGLLVSPGDLYGETAPASCASPWSSPWSGWSWWRSASLG